MKENQYILLTAAVFCLILFSCENDNDENTEFIFPLSVGNSWEYEREWTFYFYSDSTDSIPQYIDTLNAYKTDVSVTIPRKVVLGDTVETYEMIGIDSSGPYIQRRYYKEMEDGLYILGNVAGGPIVLPKKSQNNIIHFKGMEFNSFNELSNFFQSLTPYHRDYSDSINLELPPVKVLQYPIIEGDQWTYRMNYTPFRIDRKVIGRSTIELNIGSYDCYEIKFIYDINHDGVWDDDIWITDFISKQGLVQRVITLLGMEERTINYPNGTGRLFDAIDIYQLTSYDIEE